MRAHLPVIFAVLGSLSCGGSPAPVPPDAGISGCRDGFKNGDETDVDCGGSCDKCALDQICKKGGDCLTQICVYGRCREPSCADDLKNGDETDVDCGGSCPSKCSLGSSCLAGDDCRSLYCDMGTCGFGRDAGAPGLDASGGTSQAPDAGARDASAPPPGPDAGEKQDAGVDAGTPDIGRPDIGTAETSIPVLNDRNAAGHGAIATYPYNKVHFKGVVMSPIYRDYKKTSGSDPTKWYCRMGVYLADPNATVPEHNGVLVTSEGSVLQADAGTPTAGNCAEDSPLEMLTKADAGLAIGEELEVTGFFQEDCWRTTLGGPCDNKDTAGNDLARSVVEANASSSFVRTGRRPGVPATLPATISIDDIASGVRTGSGTALVSPVGPKWHDFRQVLVRIYDSKVTADNGASCNFTIQKSDATGNSLVVQDDVMFAGSSCPLRPTAGSTLNAITGFATWYTSMTQAETQLAPRSATDIQP